MPTRTVTGTLYSQDGTAATGTVSFTLLQSFETSTGVYHIGTHSETLSNGAFTITLGVPDTGTAHYQVTIPGNESHEFYLASGAATDLQTILTISGSAAAQDDLQTLLDAHTAATDPHTQYLRAIPSLLVASSTASAAVKASADYVCDGTNDEVQIQAAIDALPSGGGSILFTNGTFVLSGAGVTNYDTLSGAYCVLIDSDAPNLALIGIPGATIFKCANSQPVDMSMIQIRGSVATQRTNFVYIAGIEFDGNSANQTGAWSNWGCIGICDADNVTIENCYFHDWERNGIHAAWTSQKVKIINNRFYGQGAIRLENHHYIVMGNIFEDPNSTEIVPGGANVQIVCDADRGTTSMQCTIVGNVFKGGVISLLLNGSQNCTVMGNAFSDQAYSLGWAIAVWVYGGGEGSNYDAKYNQIIGNTIYNCANGISLEGNSTPLGAIGNIVAHNNIMKGPDRACGIGIRDGWGSTGYNQILENNIDSQVTTPISCAGVSDVIRGNVGYVTENQGAAANKGDGGTIAHGCAAAPTVATVSGSVAGEIVTVTSIDATNITIAIKKSNGDAGTAQTVYWRAMV